MTEKRFENRLDKSNVKFNTLNPTWDNEKETGLNVFEMIDELNKLSDENEQLKSENKRLKRLTTQYHVIDIEKVLPAIAECKGITVEEYLEEIEEEYTREGDLE